MKEPLHPVAPPWRSRAQGFTLLELLVVIAMLSIALALSVPNLNTGRALALAEAKAFNAALNQARNAAINLSQDVVMCAIDQASYQKSLNTDPPPATPPDPACASGGWDDGWIIFVDANADGKPAAAEVISHRSAMRAGVTVKSTPAATTVTFARGSGFTAANGSFVFCTAQDASAGRTVALAASGRAMRVSGTSSC
jgi:type IV fimbrial biogenesis protein FimT